VPTSESAWRDLAAGSAATDRNRLAEAEAHYRKALERMPYLSAACFELTRVLGAQNRIDEARKQAEVCERVYPYPVKRQWLAAWLSRLESRKR
jgi:tetratricopeptide (TPR) repeat protein